MKSFENFEMRIAGKVIVHNDFIVTDGESQVRVRESKDLVEVIEKGWLTLKLSEEVCQKDSEEESCLSGVDLVFRSDVTIEPNVEITDYIRDFAMEVDGEFMIHNDYLMTDGENQVRLQEMKDLPELLERGWVTAIAPMRKYEKDGRKVPCLNGTSLVVKEGIKATPIYEPKTYGYDCPRCGGLIEEVGVDNEYGFACDTCNYPYPDEE